MTAQVNTLQNVLNRVQRLIDEQGADAPAAAFIFTNEDVFVMDEEGNPDYVSREIASDILDTVEDYDYIYTVIADCIEEELAELKVNVPV